jgi:hypothetical protein
VFFEGRDNFQGDGWRKPTKPHLPTRSDGLLQRAFLLIKFYIPAQWLRRSSRRRTAVPSSKYS